MIVPVYYVLAQKKNLKIQFKSKIKLSSVIALTVPVVCDGGNGDSKSLAVC